MGRTRDTDGERGSVTAEFALSLPAIVAVLLLVLSLGAYGVQAVALESAAREAARQLARGEPPAAVEAAARDAAGGDIIVSLAAEGPYTRVSLSRHVRIAGWVGIDHAHQAEASARTEHVSGARP
ncbi:TadE family type IV pilus minor pilin [Nesterenkonia sp. NBAIMH1]|uniref:TadE family type IV pilus minor pilin n=1 Tax=Nesterenkonia sp. NBAIMH1 TaxID=2600320 RepID=UPI0011B6EA79|nr:TadE family type IV pilus minor pilin [Nesterenkonia sp. NBAIMH1]